MNLCQTSNQIMDKEMNLPPKSVVYKNFIELRLLSPKDGPAIFQAVQDSQSSLKKFMSWAHYANDLIKACSIYADFEAKSLKGEEANFAGFDVDSGEFLFCASLIPSSRLNHLAFDIGYWVSSKRLSTEFISACFKRVLDFQPLSVLKSYLWFQDRERLEA